MIGKISGAIPVNRKVKDHVEADVNHFGRGKSHTIPSAEADIKLLQEQYHMKQLHKNLKREQRPGDKAKDHMMIGMNPSKLDKRLNIWHSKRSGLRDTEQCYEGDSTPEGSENGDVVNDEDDEEGAADSDAPMEE